MIHAKQEIGLKDKTGLVILSLVYTSFIILGFPAGMLGVAWPSIRDAFSLENSALGTLLLAHTIGYLSASFYNGQIIKIFGIMRMLMFSCLVAALGFAGFIFSPSWEILIFFGFLAGLGGGAVDSGVNTFMATYYGPRLMSGVHACFGIGATLGPLVITAILEAGYAWRWGYVIASGGWVVMVLGFALWMASNPNKRFDVKAESGQESSAPLKATLQLPLVWMSIMMFILYVGVEIGTGNWVYTLFTEGRAIDLKTAGIWVSIYWGSLSVGRALFGIIPIVDRVGIIPLVRACLLGMLIGTGLLFWNPANRIGFLGLALIGFSQAPVFPLLISQTPYRVGSQHAPNTIGFQVAGAGIGVALIPGIMGILLKANEYEVLARFLVVNALMAFALHEIILRYEIIQRPDHRSPSTSTESK